MTTAEQGDEIRIPKGAVIFRQGDPGNEMFVLSEGRVRLTIGTGGHEKEVALLGPGEFFGELSLLSDEPRTATAVAVEDTALLAIGRDVFAMLVQDDLEIVFRMMNIQGRRLSLTNLPIEDLTQRLGRVRIAGHCLRELTAGNGQLPYAVDAQRLVSELGLSPEAVNATLADLVHKGVGSLHDNRWSIETREQANKLLDAICSYAQVP